MSHTAKAFVYKTKPTHEHKAVREFEQHRINAVVPFDDTGKRKRVTIPGYVFAGRELQAAFVKHVGAKIGTTPVEAIARLYLFKPKPPARIDNPFQVGDIAIRGEIEVRVAHVSGRICRIEWTMLGKTHTQSIHYSQLRPG